MFERCALDFGGCACVLCYLKPSLPLWFYGRLEGMESGQMGFCFFFWVMGAGWLECHWVYFFHLFSLFFKRETVLYIHCAIQWWTSTFRTSSKTGFCRVPWRLLVWDAQIHPRFIGCSGAPSPKRNGRNTRRWSDDPMIFFCTWAASKLQPEWVMLDFWSRMDTK